jgi:hypothetical protein
MVAQNNYNVDEAEINVDKPLFSTSKIWHLLSLLMTPVPGIQTSLKRKRELTL